MIASANAIFSALCCAIHKKFTFGRQQKKSRKNDSFLIKVIT